MGRNRRNSRKKALFGNNRGSILIVVLGVLSILSLLATVFASIQQTERNISRNHVDNVRARLVAVSGVEHGIEQMRQMVDLGSSGFTSKTWRYYGDDTLELGDNPSTLNTPLEEAKNPSFALEVDDDPMNADPTPKLVKVNGKEIGITSFHNTGTYGMHGDFYSVRVRDLQGAIYVNDGVGQPGTSDTNSDGSIDNRDSSVSQNLRRILNNLGSNSDINVVGLGDKILEKRPQHGYRHLRELKTVLGADDYQKVERFLTAYAWVDTSVANPVPLSKEMKADYPVNYYRGNDIYRYGRGKNALGNQVTKPLKFSSSISSAANYAVLAMDELNPQWIEMVSRAPVNINAAEKEVLVALLDGLQGFFLLERRANNPRGWKSAYSWAWKTHSYDVVEDTKVGDPGPYTSTTQYLYSTVPIVGPGSVGTSTTGQTISAEAIAEHMIACRNKTVTPASVTPGFDYSTVWFGGEFGSWKQFNAFSDNLVEIGLFTDTRNFVDYNDATLTIQSQIQQDKAAQAIADVLKANFNPNLHLNEINPDANLYQFVDKTDLITNSTEFVFLPCGYFEVESVGYVVRPDGSNTDVLLADDNQIVARKKVSTVVRLYEVLRHTSQKDFVSGELSKRGSYPISNNNLSLEIGPEPDQGLAPSENEWGGYISLPTNGGIGKTKDPKTVENTPAGSNELGSALHGHFSGDYKLHHHVNGHRDELATTTIPGEYVENVPDRTESMGGPYGPTTSGANTYRLARSFRMKEGQSTAPALNYRAPLDLRIDGAYSERNSAPAYWLSKQVFGNNIASSQGAIAMWIKPNYFPGMSGKPRVNLNMDRYHNINPNKHNPSPFSLIYMATHDRPAYQASLSENGTPYYQCDIQTWQATGGLWGVLNMRPMSLGWGYGFSGTTGYYGTMAEGGTLTPTLNHLQHPDSSKPSPLQAHKWMHVVVTWQMSDKSACKVYVNGKFMSGNAEGWYKGYHANSGIDWTKHGDGSRNSIRLGSVSKFRNTPTFGHRRNWAADATFDELYFWNNFGAYNVAKNIWKDGRYRKPESGQEAYYLSKKINLTSGQRLLPPPSSIQPPNSTGGICATGIGAPSSSASKVRILGASWTWFTGMVDSSTGESLLEDHATNSGVLHPKVELSILENGTETTPLSDERYSAVFRPDGKPMEVTGDFQYRVRFSIPDQAFDSILLETPVFDDVTIFYQTSESMFVHYVME
ncbi:MAG: hypothetical protein QF645_01855 [Planctomycetota bacterium]|nr:hypothetical protein [Planctomycetota bacterium]